MAVYLIAEVKVTDPAWIPEYAANVHNIVAAHGGKYLSRSGNIDTIEKVKNWTPVLLHYWSFQLVPPWMHLSAMMRTHPLPRLVLLVASVIFVLSMILILPAVFRISQRGKRQKATLAYSMLHCQ